MRALLLVLDGAGCGNAPDARAYGDGGANSLGHLFRQFPNLEVPVLDSLGLWKVVTGDVFSSRAQGTSARWGRLRPCSAGKSATIGHWELAGVISNEPFAVFPDWPTGLVQAISRDARVRFLSAETDCGADALSALGGEHLKTGEPIAYLSEDSALHFAAHESVLSTAKLYEICRIARKHADLHKIAHIFAVPFTGIPGAFREAPGHRDFSIVPPRTVLNAIAERGLPVQAVGSVGSIFASSGITRSLPAASDVERMSAIEQLWSEASDGLIFANLSECGAAGDVRNPIGYGQMLQQYDAWLTSFLPRVEPDDLVIITSSHGSDPTFPGHENTREETPLLVLHGRETGPLGTRRTFADTAATLAEYFQIRRPWPIGESFLQTKSRIPKNQSHRPR